MLKNVIPSPCVRNCCLDRNNICLGCGRHVDDIVGWQSASDEQKLSILASAQARRDERAKLRQQRDNPRLRPH